MHTPGPWTATFEETNGYDCMTGGWDIESAERQVALVDQSHYGQPGCEWDFRSPEAEANARLIAAAPDLLEALRMAVSAYHSSGEMRAKAYRTLYGPNGVAEALIKRATG